MSASRSLAPGWPCRLPERRIPAERDRGRSTTPVHDRDAAEGAGKGARRPLPHGLSPHPPIELEIDGRRDAPPAPGPEALTRAPAGTQAGGAPRSFQLCWGDALYARMAPDLPAAPATSPALGLDPLLGSLLRALVEEIGAGTLDRLLAESLLGAIATRAAQRHGAAPPGRAPDLPRQRLQRVLDHIEANLGEELGLAELAAVACISPFHLSRSFKAALGIGPQRYVMRRRVERAKALLAQTALPLVAIAQELGFSDQSHFTNVFRREAGTTPARFRAAAAA